MKEFNTSVTDGEYRITFATDDKKAFKEVQTFCRKLIDCKGGEAIPIEWIKQFADNIWWEDERAVIEDMIAEWEEENG